MTGKSAKDQGRNPQIGGDQNVIQGNISGGVVVQGRGARVNVQQTSGITDKELAVLFDKIYVAVQSRPPDPGVDKEEINGTVQNIEREIKKGDQANESKLQRWMDNLYRMAPDIIDVILASLGGPVSGATAVLKKLAQHAH